MNSVKQLLESEHLLCDMKKILNKSYKVYVSLKSSSPASNATINYTGCKIKNLKQSKLVPGSNPK